MLLRHARLVNCDNIQINNQLFVDCPKLNINVNLRVSLIVSNQPFHLKSANVKHAILHDKSKYRKILNANDSLELTVNTEKIVHLIIATANVQHYNHSAPAGAKQTQHSQAIERMHLRFNGTHTTVHIHYT